MNIRFVAGQWVKFHGKMSGKRVFLEGIALESGETGVAQKFRIETEQGVIRVSGKNIYIVRQLPSTPNSDEP